MRCREHDIGRAVPYAILITYAVYADRTTNLGRVAIITLIADTSLSLLADLTVFPLVFAHGLDPSGGPGMVFVMLPLAFAGIPLGRLVAVAFFSCLAIAAISSAISMLEMPVAVLRRRMAWRRAQATVVSSGVIWCVGLATVASFSSWRDWRPLAAIGLFANAIVFDVMDGLSSNLLLPVTGLGISLFAGWVLPAEALALELRIGRWTARLLSLLLRYVVPILIGLAAVDPWLQAH